MTGCVRVLVAGLAIVALAGCAGPAAPPPAPTAIPDPIPTIDERFTPDIPAELRVRDPLDARGLRACDLLTPAQLDGFGLDPSTARTETTKYGEFCSLRYRDGSTVADIGLGTDPRSEKLPDAYRLRENSTRFEIRQIAGYPAIRDDTAPQECNLGLAVADSQLVEINAYYDGRVLPDPCGPATRMAELIIANLKARR